jgi:CHAD domain-containing protein
MRTSSVGPRSSATPRLVPTRAKAAHPGRLSHLVDDQLERLSKVAALVLASDDAEAVHDLRVVTRRLQQLLAVVSARPRPKRIARLRRRLRRVRRALGTWRNYDVTLASVGARQRATRSPRRRAVWRVVREHLERSRLEEMIRARRRLLEEDLTGLVDRLRAVLVDSVGGVATENIDLAVRSRAETAWQEWQAAFARAEAKPDVTEVHALRIATKRLRYRVELTRGLGEAAADAVVDWARRVQHHLGDWHDHQILQRLMAEALARPELLLNDVDVAASGVAELARERESAPPNDPAVLRAVSAEEGRQAVGEWLSQAPGIRSG